MKRQGNHDLSYSLEENNMQREGGINLVGAGSTSLHQSSMISRSKANTLLQYQIKKILFTLVDFNLKKHPS